MSALGGPSVAFATRAHAGAAWRLAHDPERPQFHLLPKRNWMNDPDGPIYRDGVYHLFYQYNPGAAHWGDIHWGHAISADKVHWRHLPVALAPTPGGPDAAGCFSGSAVRDGDTVAVFYTGVVKVPPARATLNDGVHSFRETQCLAIGSGKRLETWTKRRAPVIPAPPPGLDVLGFRDPFVWRHGEEWRMVLGSGIRGRGGAILLYRSTDLEHWSYVDVLAHGTPSGRTLPNPVDAGDMWECPNVFALGDRHVLTYSTRGKTRWITGRLDQAHLKFIPGRHGIVDHGTYYAATTQLDANGNRVLWGWIGETRPKAAYEKAGWAGMMSLPRLLDVDGAGQLRMRFDPALHALRRRGQHLVPTRDEVRNRDRLRFMRIQRGCGEILCEFEAGDAPLHLQLATAGAGGRVWLEVAYDPAHPQRVLADGQAIPLHRDGRGRGSLHMYIDGSVIESILGGAAAYTKRFYYASSVAPTIRVNVKGDTRGIKRLSMWQIEPISRDRLAS